MSKHLYTWFTCCLFALLTALPMSVNAQQTITLSESIEQDLTPGTTYTFYDSGGADGGYATNESYTAVFTNSGDITINFSSLTTEGSSSCSNWDYLLIYDGDASTGTLLGRGQTSCSSSISLNQDYVATSGTMTVVWHSDSSTPAAGWVATITAGAAQACPRPKSLAVSDITNNSATLTWKAGGSETQWEVVIGDNAPVFATDTFVALTGLTAVTTYGVSLRAICGAGDTSGVVTTSFKTLQVPANLPYNTGFEATDDNALWSILSGASTNKWAFGSATNNGGSNAMYISDNNGTANSYSVVSSASSVSLAYRLLHFAEEGDYNVNFDWKNKGESYDIMGVFLIPGTVDMDAAKITLASTGSAVLDGMTLSSSSPYASTAQGKGWITLLTEKSTYYSQFYGQETWAHYAGSIHLAEAKDYYILFFWRNNTYTQNNPPAAVDNLQIKKKPCADVSGIKVFGIAGTTANVSWNAIGGAAGYEYVVLPDTAAFDATGKVAVTDTVATISGLTANTSYKVYVRSSCGAGEETKGDWSAGVQFTTKCDPIATLPWTESFEGSLTGSGNLPECWSYVQSYDGTSVYPYTYNSTYSSYEGSQCLYFYGGAVTSSANSEQIVALPGISADLSNARIRFYYKSTVGASYGHLSLGKVTDLDNPSTFVEILPLEQTGSYVEVEQPLASVGNAYIAFKYAGGTSTTSAYVDTIIVDLIPSCYPVSNLIVADVKSDNALLKWTDDSRNTSAAKYRVSVTVGESALVSDTIVTKAELRLKGLTPATSYEDVKLTIVRVCGETDESEAYTGYVTFNTDCNVISELPWTENFETLAKGSSTASAPLCWALAEANDGTYPYIYVNNSTSYVHGGSQSLYFQSSSSRSGFVILPAFASGLLEGSELIFYYKHESATSSGVPTVGYITDITDTATFVAIQALPRSTTWQEADVELPTIPSGARLAIRYGKATNQNYYMGIDDIVVRKVPTCIAPVSVSVIDSLITTNSATIQWSDAAGEAGNYLVTVKKDNTIFNGYENVAVNGDTTFVINGLEHSTTYSLSVSIVKVCASANSYPLESTLSFATACDLFTNLPLIEDFESYTATTYAEAGILPACWTGYSVPSSSTTTTYVPHVIGSGSYWYTQSGTKSLSLYGRGDNYVALPEFAAALNTLQLSFWYRFESASYGTLTVGYITANDADFNTFTAIETVPAHAVTMIEYEKSLENIPAEAVRLAIHFNAGIYACCIDDVVVEKIPTCPKPSNVTLAAVTATSASFTWTSGESAASYSVEVYNGNTRLDSAVIAASELPYVIDTLQPNTDYAYTFKVYAMCGAEDGNSRAVTSEVELHTPCALIPETADPFSFTENFDAITTTGSGKLPECWGYAKSYGTSTIYPYVYNSSSYAYSGTKCLYFYGGSSTSEEIVTLPGIETPLSTLRIFLRYKATSSTYTGASYPSLTVGVMSNPSDPATFVPLKTLAKVADHTQAEVLLSAAPADCHYIALRYAGGTSFGYTVVDDIEIMPLPACPQPADVIVSDVAQYTANVSWIPSGSETQWGVSLYKDTAMVQYHRVSAASIALTNLDEKTTYRISVRALCSATDSSEVASASFHTTGEIIPAEAYSNDFENAAENAKWTVKSGSGAANTWTIGNGVNNGGANAMYVSKDANGTYGYAHSACASYIYRTFHFEAEDYVINFDWKGHGESSFDGMAVMLIPASVDLDGATISTSSITIDGVSVSLSAPLYTTAPYTEKGWIPLINPLTPTVKYSRFNLVDEWQADTKFDLSFDAPVNYHLVFFWRNDGGGGSEPSAAVDNLVVAKKLCGDMGDIHQTDATIESATIAWAAVEGAVSYEYVVLAEGETLNADDAEASTDTIVTITDLEHSSYYTIAVRAICSEGAGMWKRIVFHTECDVLPNEGELAIGFEQYATGINLKTEALCWDTLCPNGAVSAAWTIASVAHEGSKSVSIANVPAGKSAVLVSPQFEFYYGYELVAFVSEGTTHSDADSVIFYINDEPTLEGAARIGDVKNLSSDWTEFREKLPTEWFVDPTIEDETAELYEYAYILVEAYASKTIYIDDVLLHEAPQCATAKNIRIDSISSNAIRVVWDAAAGQDNWVVEYRVKNAGVQGTPEISGEPVLVIENLMENTLDSLFISIESYCGDETSELAEAAIAFHTECGIVDVLPWSEGFDSLTSGIPDCWNNDEGTTTSASYKWTYYATGREGACLRFNSYTNSSNLTNVLATPVIVLPADPAELLFWCMNPTGGNFNVSISVAGGARQVLLSGLTGISSWTQKNVDLTAYAGQSVQIFFNATSNYGTGDAYIYLDDVKVRVLPTCYAPDAVSVKNITATTATLVWNSKGENTSYSISVNNADPVLVQDTIFVVENLEAATAYTLPVAITTICNETDFSEEYVTRVAFTTSCLPIADATWTESFENLATGSTTSDAPQCWALLNANEGSYPYIYVSTNSTYVRTGSKCLFFNNNASNATYGYAIMPEFADLSNSMMTFSYKDESATNSGTLDVGYLTDITDEATFVSLQSFAKSASWVDEATVYLNTVPAGARIAFRYGPATTTYYYLGIDDIVVKPVPTCFKPSGVELVAVDDASASFNWTGDAENYVVEVYNGMDRIDSLMIAAADLPYVIDTLQPNSDYAFRFMVYGQCSETDKSEVVSSLISVHTLCQALAITDTWVETFDSLTAGIPDCWNNEEGTVTTASYKWNMYATGYEGKCVRFNSYNNSEGIKNVLATPMLTLPEAASQLEFWYKNPAGGDFTVSIAVNGRRDTLLSDLTGVANWTLEKVMLAEYAGETIQILFNGTSNWGSNDAYIYLDSVAISPAPTCMPVKNISRLSLTMNEVVFTWESNGSEQAWNVVVTDLLNENAVLLNNTVNAPNVSVALEANTKYSLRVSVAANCGEGDVAEAVSKDFTFRSPMAESMVQAIANTEEYAFDLSSADEQAKWALVGAEETNHFIFATFNNHAGLYISSDDIAWQYDTDEESAAIAYRAFSVPEDNTPIKVSFKWQANGEGSYDFGRAFIASADAEIDVIDHEAVINGTDVAASNAITAVHSVANNNVTKLNEVTAEQSLNDETAVLGAGSYLIIFTWKNDDYQGNQNPLGVYDLKIRNMKGVDPTSIIDINGDGTEAYKFIHNGQVYILRDGVVYTILGTIVR